MALGVIAVANGFVNVLGLLFLADVELFGGLLTLGEGITSQYISLPSFQ